MGVGDAASGSRVDPPVVARASGLLLAEGALLSESLSRLAPPASVPKGVYRFKSHDEANRHHQDCLVRAMGLLAARRRDG